MKGYIYIDKVQISVDVDTCNLMSHNLIISSSREESRVLSGFYLIDIECDPLKLTK